jgi:Uma2 family endonuclease
MDAPLPQRYTYADRQGWDSNTRWELIDGHPYAMSSPNSVHQSILGELYLALKAHLKGSGCKVMLAPFDVKFTDYDVVQPDLLVSCGDRLGYAFHDGAPDLVVEILSRSTMRHDRIRKLGLYAQHHVPEYWLVTQQPFIIEVLANEKGVFATRGAYDQDGILLSPRFPELRLNLSEIAAELPPQPPIPNEVRESAPVYSSSPS